MLQSKGLPAFDCDCLRTWAARLLVAEGFTRSQLESVCCYARVQLQLQGSSDVQLLQALEETVLGRTVSHVTAGLTASFALDVCFCGWPYTCIPTTALPTSHIT